MGRFLLTLLLALAWPAAGEEKAFVLVAKKGLPDKFFRDAVVLVVANPLPIGVILNKPLDDPLSSYFPGNEKVRAHGARVFFGGPVKREHLVFVFRAAKAHDRAIEVMPGVHLSMSRELLLELLERGEPAEGLRIDAGHAGWAPGQLEAETERGSWHVLPAQPRMVFDEKPELLWRQLESRATATMVQAPN